MEDSLMKLLKIFQDALDNPLLIAVKRLKPTIYGKS